jgi:transcription antitermination factor NusG
MTLIEPSLEELPPRPPVEVGDLKWYAVRVAPRCETPAAADLRNAGVIVFAPTARHWRKRRRGRLVSRWHHVERPLLVGYILVGVARPTDWLHIRQAEGYAYTVSQDSDPLVIPTRDIVKLQERVVCGEFDEDQRPRRRRNPYRAGQAVTVDMAGQDTAKGRVIKASGEQVIVELIESGMRVRAGLDRVADRVVL